MSQVKAVPLVGGEVLATSFDSTMKKESLDQTKKAAAAVTADLAEAQKTRELTEEEKIYLEIERIRRLLFKMDLKELMEIRGYPRPPAGLEPLLTCNLVLLGHAESELKSWGDIKKKIVKVG